MSDASAGGESFPYERLTKPYRRRRVVEQASQNYHPTESVRREKETTWCKTCSRFRSLRHVDWRFELYKGSWWRYWICSICGDTLREDALE